MVVPPPAADVEQAVDRLDVVGEYQKLDGWFFAEIGQLRSLKHARSIRIPM